MGNEAHRANNELFLKIKDSILLQFIRVVIRSEKTFGQERPSHQLLTIAHFLHPSVAP